MKKKLLAIAATLLTMMLPVTAMAETYSGGDGWSVYFDGSKMTSSFKNTDMDDVLMGLQPGDDANFHLSLENKYSNATDWYMTNEVLQSLEESQTVANGGAYSYLLTYIDPEGKSTVLYDSDKVGGENSEDVNKAAGEGLHQATDSLEEWFFLDRLEAGEKAEITLYVKLEGETQGNTYQDTMAKLQMNFAVELADTTSTPPSPGTTSTSSTGNTTTSSPSVKTGDYSRPLLFAIVALIAGLICAGVAIYNVKSSQNAKRRPTKKSERKGRES